MWCLLDKRTPHDGLTNNISFNHNDKKIVIYPLTPQQVREDQIILKKKLETEKRGRKLSQNLYRTNK